MILSPDDYRSINQLMSISNLGRIEKASLKKDLTRRIYDTRKIWTVAMEKSVYQHLQTSTGLRITTAQWAADKLERMRYEKI